MGSAIIFQKEFIKLKMEDIEIKSNRDVGAMYCQKTDSVKMFMDVHFQWWVCDPNRYSVQPGEPVSINWLISPKKCMFDETGNVVMFGIDTKMWVLETLRNKTVYNHRGVPVAQYDNSGELCATI
jgi:hypothetical protein